MKEFKQNAVKIDERSSQGTKLQEDFSVYLILQRDDKILAQFHEIKCSKTSFINNITLFKRALLILIYPH